MKTHTKRAIPLAAVFAAMLIVGITPAFAEVTISAAEGSGAPGCEETPEGCYLPDTVIVDVGSVITMSNPDTAAHTFTSGTPGGDDVGAMFDSSLVMAGGSYQYTLDTAGEVPYFCMVHPWMTGVIVVQEASAEPTMETQVWETEQLMAEIVTGEGKINEPMSIDLTVTDLEGDWIQHFTYNVKATQGSEVLLDENGHMHQGTITNNHVTSALPMAASDSMPVVLTVESVGFGHDGLYVEAPGEIATKQVVPEFGTIAVMILAVAIISIIAVSAKSRLVIIPRI